MFEEKREAVMAIEAAVAVSTSSVDPHAMQNARSRRPVGVQNKSVIAGTFIG